MKTNEISKKTDRNSSIELVKLAAILLIVISHSLPYGFVEGYNCVIDLGKTTTDLQYIIMGFFHNMGQIGNDIFLMCSVWFLLDDNIINKRKIAYIISDCFIISNIMLIAFLFMGYQLSGKYILTQIFPTIYGGNWYITCYLLLYIIHPYLNILITNLDKKALLRIDIAIVTLYCIINVLESSALFFYNNLIGFIVIYFIVAYIKKYMINYIKSYRFNICCIALGVFVWIIQNIFINFLGRYINYFSDKCQQWNTLINPCFIIIALGVLGIANNKTFCNRIINYLASLSLLIYVFHCNRIIRDYLRFDIFEYIYNHYTYQKIMAWVLLYAVVSLVFGVLCAVIYDRTIKNIIKFFVDKIVLYLTKVYVKVEKKILKK